MRLQLLLPVLLLLVSTFFSADARAVIWSPNTTESKSFQICGASSVNANEAAEVFDFVPGVPGLELHSSSVDWSVNAIGQRVHRNYERFYSANNNRLVRRVDYNTLIGNAISWRVDHNTGLASRVGFPQGFLVQGTCVFWGLASGFQGFSDRLHIVVRDWKTNKIVLNRYYGSNPVFGKISNYSSKIYDFNGDGSDDIAIVYVKQNTILKKYISTIFVRDLKTGALIKRVSHASPYVNAYTFIPAFWF